ncbi:MAG: HEAT repeat domain-containing protein [Planctomycetia bacterium]|nr:HEAT repeat domain-containing protein [Planctomycetia bacterium]
MRTILGWGLLGILLTGCGASAPPLPPTTRSNRPAPAPVVRDVIFDNTPTPEQEAAAKAAQLAERLTEPDEAARRQACLDLNGLGSAGYPYLVKAFKGDVYELSLMALESMSAPAFQEHAVEMAPLLLQRLTDSDPTMRRLAAERLAWFDRAIGGDDIYPGPQAKERLAALQKAARLDKDSGVRALAQSSAQQVQQAVNGRLAQLDARTGGGSAVPTNPNERPKREIPR